MSVRKVGLIFLTAFFSFMLANLTGGFAYAEDETTITFSDDEVVMNLLQGNFGEGSQTITASTTNAAGYTVGIRTTGASSALTNIDDDSYTIPTFVLPEGAESIPVSEIGDGYGYSIDGGENYLPIPAPSLHSTTLFKTSTAGTNTYELTFGVKVPMGTRAGTYENTFVIEAVANLDPCEIGNICYFGNGDDGTGEMEDQLVESSSVTLIPSNFSRSGYGFVGWNTELDGTGTDYGPSQTITFENYETEGLQLYAKWVQSAGDLQGWKGCETMEAGDVTALTDTRDGSTYAVAKYADSKCWMMENLRLDLSNEDVEINSQTTNRPDSDFATEANEHPDPSSNFCAPNTAACVDNLYYNISNIDRSNPADYDANDSGSSWYSYGVYYNYYTATAGYGGSSFATKGAIVSGDLCPAGWRLPTAYTVNDDFGKLDIAYGGNGKSQESGAEAIAGSERWRAYPLNYMFSGEWRGAVGYNRGASSSTTTANTSTAVSTFNLWLRPIAVNMTANSTNKPRGQTIRCVAKQTNEARGNVHYEKNGGTGTMPDETDVEFATANAAPNQFTRTNSRFIGWNTKSDGTGYAVADGGALENVAIQLQLEDGDTLTLYAMWQAIYDVVYAGNGETAGSMASVTHENVTESFTLDATNYSKTGYGFAGWSTDNDAGTKLLSHDTVKVYGPNQLLQFDNELKSHADANNQITLYAVWLPSDATDTLQTFSKARCTSMNVGEVLGLRDERDGNVYTVSKLVDNNCWIAENLRLNPSTTTFTSANTNGPTAAFIADAPASQDLTTLCNDDTDTCIDRILFNGNNLNRSMTASPTTNNNSSSWYGYGMMYGWYAATAGNGNYSMASGNVAGDICPAGWRLPTSGTNGEFTALTRAVGGSTTAAINANMLSFPNNFIYSGDYNYNTSGGRGSYGRYWSATSNTNIKAYRLGVDPSKGVTPSNTWNKWDAFAVRCIVK